MKTLKTLLILLMLSLIYACSNTSSPSNIAKVYIKAVMAYNFEEAAQYVTTDMQSSHESLIHEVSKMDAKTVSMVRAVLQDAKFEVTQEQLSDSSAEITVKIEQKGSNFLDHHILLKKEDNTWKVSQSAELLNYEVIFHKKYGIGLNEIKK